MVCGIKIFISHLRAIALLVQSFLLVVNRYVHSESSSLSLLGNYYYCISWPLKITSSGILALVTKIHFTIVVHIRDSGCFNITAFVADEPTHKPLIPKPSISPVSSIFHLSYGQMSLITGIARRRNHSLMTSVLAPFNHLISIRQFFLVFKTGYLLTSFRNQYLPTMSYKPAALSIQFTKTRIWL